MAAVLIAAVWILLFQFVSSKVITVNNNGNDSVECCVDGTCPCGSLHYALQHLTSNSTINITSESVTLNTTTPRGSLNNITITGNGATIMCNNSGGVYCESCSDVIIEGITWDQCFTSRLLSHALSINITRCNFCFTENDMDLEMQRLSGNRTTSIQDSSFTKCGDLSENYSVVLHLSFEGNGQSAFLISNSTFSMQLHFYEEMSMSLNLMVQSSSFYTGSGLSLILKSPLAIVQINKTAFYNGYQIDDFNVPLHIHDSDVTNTTILVSNTQFVNYSNSTLIINNLFGINSNITLNNILFTGNVGSFYECVRITTRIEDDLHITFDGTHFTSNIYTSTGIVCISNNAGSGNNNFYAKFRHCSWMSNTVGNPSLYVGTEGSKMLDSEFSDCEFMNSTSSSICIKARVSETINCKFSQCTFVNNTSVGHGAALYLFAQNSNKDTMVAQSTIAFSRCSFQYNGGRSILYVYEEIKQVKPELILYSSNFTNNTGSALFISSTELVLQSQNLFQHNQADNGAAMYFAGNSHLILRSSNSPSAMFIGNAAKFRGGAIYVDFDPNRLYCTLVTTDSQDIDHINYPVISFATNFAGIAGNDVYLKFHKFCGEFTDPTSSSNTSAVFIPNRFNYTQPDGAIATPPYKVNLCSPASCDLTSNICIIDKLHMSGHPVHFNATVCDYFNNIARETAPFTISCVGCDSATYNGGFNPFNFILQKGGICLRNGSETIVFTSRNLYKNTYITTLNMISALPPEYKLIEATLSINVSSCFNGFVFNISSKACECYHDSTIIQCNGDHAEIKLGYYWWSVTRKVYICPYSCNFGHRAETRNGYYELPKEPNAQCREHKEDGICSLCNKGYTLAYNAPDCVDERKCSWMLPLVIVLTILYWIVIVVGVSALTHSKLKISLGHLYGLLYYYSVIDVLLGNVLSVSDGLFQLVAVISGFTKLSPTVIGKLCFVKGLQVYDQQFINYIHVVAVLFILFGISKAAKYSRRIAQYGKHFIVRAVSVLLLMSYTSLISTTTILLTQVLIVPSIESTFERLIAYFTISLLFFLVFGIGLPCLLLLEPLIRRKINITRIKPLLDQYQGSYRDKYRWFAAYYLICRLVIFAIGFVPDYQIRLYCLQTACIVIALIHTCVQPYKHKVLNILDSIILLNMVLVVNLGTFLFAKSTTIGLAVTLVIFHFVYCVS